MKNRKEDMTENTTVSHPLEILAPEGPHEIIHISDEQAAPMASLEVFKEKLASFTEEDYYGDEPYDLLVRSSQFAWNQYDQFAAVLLAAARAASVEDGAAEAAVDMYRDIFIKMAGDTTDILSAIEETAADEAHKDDVSVLSIPCGSGKSTALTKLICKTIRQNNGEGLIIVTDSIERMGEYWRHDSTNPQFDDTMLRFIENHQNQVAVMTSQNYEQMKSRQYYAPVVVLTTQRYFGWTQDRVKELLRWKEGKRSLIIFDEAPYLSTERDVTVSTLNAVATALRICIEAPDEKSRKAKYEAIAFWEEVRTTLLNQMDQLEYTPDLQYAYIGGQEDEALDKFIGYVRENQSWLDTDRIKIVQMAEDAACLLRGWGVYSHRNTPKSGKYESKYTVHVDHRDLVTGLNAKVIVLDGTAEISPMYDEDYIHLHSDRSFTRSLSYLTIKLCDVPTAESDLRDDPSQTAKMILNYLAAATGHDNNLIVFSSEKMERQFHLLGFDQKHTGHFNNIKGLNNYSIAQNIAQVGLNRKPPVEYLTLDLAHNEEVRKKLAAETISEGPVDAMRNARVTMDYDTNTMAHHVLTDLEQNMYRGVIRSAANTKPYTYYIFFDHERNKPLIDMIKKRYEALDAKVEFVSRSEVEKFKPKSALEERIDAIEGWYKNWDGSPIKQSAVYKKLGMSRNDFNYVLAHEKAENIRGLIEEAKEAAQSAGEKKGWLMKKR